MKSDRNFDKEIDNLIMLLYQVEDKAKQYIVNGFNEKNNSNLLTSEEAKYLNTIYTNEYNKSVNKQDWGFIQFPRKSA